MWNLIPLKWKVGLIAGGFGLLILVSGTSASIAYVAATSKDAGRLQCENASKDATIKSQEQALKEILDGINQLHEEENEIISAPPESDDLMGSGLIDQLNSM